MVKALKAIYGFLDDRLGIKQVLEATVFHRIPKSSASWNYVFGSATLTCLVVQVVTGVALAMLYQPSTQSAYESLQWITHSAPLGSWLRGLHYFGASGMVVLMVVHLIRVYLMASYKYPREMNWLTGVVLLGLTVSMAFTGQLLRWDDVGVWSTYVAAEQMGRIPFVGTLVAHLLIGGETVGGHTLTRFFAYHVFVFPAMLFAFVGIHLYLVLKHGISEPPTAGKMLDPETYKEEYEKEVEADGVPFFPFAAWRDAVFSLAVILVLTTLALTVGPPQLGGPPDPSHIDVSPSPDWYLVWVFALYALMPPGIEDYVIVAGPIVALGLFVAIPFLTRGGERHPMRRPWSIIFVFVGIGLIGALTLVGMKAPWSPKFNAKPLTTDVFAAAPDAEESHGMDLFNKKGCLYCHNIDGHGGHRGPNLTQVGDRLDSSEIVVRIVNGGKLMPAYGGVLKKNEIEALSKFLLAPKKK